MYIIIYVIGFIIAASSTALAIGYDGSTNIKDDALIPFLSGLIWPIIVVTILAVFILFGPVYLFKLYIHKLYKIGDKWSKT